MATGHSHSGGGFSEQALDRCLEHKGVKAELKRPFKVDKTHDVPFLGGMSKDGKTVYIDRHLPALITIGHKKVNVLPYILVHERTEKAIMDQMGYTYSSAHNLATKAEHRKVREHGLKPADYEKALKPYIKADEHEKITKPPPDLEPRPYLQESDAMSRALWKHMQDILHGQGK